MIAVGDTAAVRAFTSCKRCGVGIVRDRERAPICAYCRGVLANAPATTAADTFKRSDGWMRMGAEPDRQAADVRA